MSVVAAPQAPDTMVASQGLPSTPPSRPALAPSLAEVRAMAREAFTGQIDTVAEFGSPHRLRALDSAQLERLAATPREVLIDPILCRRSLLLLRGPRGVGCTQVAIGCAVALASGSPFLGWRVPQPQRVLLVAGSMPTQAVTARIGAARTIGGSNAPLGDRLSLLTLDTQAGGLPDLGTLAGQTSMARSLANVDIVVFDDFAAMLPGMQGESGPHLQKLREFLVTCRLCDRTVIAAQHSGIYLRCGADRAVLGLVESLADVVIALRHPPDYRAEQGARFELHIDRATHLPGTNRKARVLHLADCGDGRQVWRDRSIEDARKVAFFALLSDGVDIRTAGRETGISQATAYRWNRDAPKMGTVAASENSVRI